MCASKRGLKSGVQEVNTGALIQQRTSPLMMTDVMQDLGERRRRNNGICEVKESKQSLETALERRWSEREDRGEEEMLMNARRTTLKRPTRLARPVAKKGGGEIM